ncbi:hypothetical protein [Nocardia macrotermitis]|uniref:Uncharacterized protein n=1 Tax=Nocardia macrotermitis TaxID=2585198 RepID=A0A7K0DAD8_9NOCA|nr:hypothetical protein [Nocardia macrotermitis]MQY22292.1 hypothetical protein [Nocardia macrotermitis]
MSDKPTQRTRLTIAIELTKFTDTDVDTDSDDLSIYNDWSEPETRLDT